MKIYVGRVLPHQYGRLQKVTYSPKGLKLFEIKKESTEGKING